MATTTLFVDGLPQGIAREWLLDVFAQYGRIEDVYISRKKRTSNKNAFGFVRFKNHNEAATAIDKLNGFLVKGKKMIVSVAKYERGGSLGSNKRSLRNPPPEQRNYIRFPSIHDNRKYMEVVKGKQSIVNQLKVDENRGLSELRKILPLVRNYKGRWLSR